MAEFKSVLEDYNSYIRQQDDMFEKIEHSKELETKQRLERELTDLLGAIYDAFSSQAASNGSVNPDFGFIEVFEGLHKELADTQSIRDSKIATKEDRSREKLNLEDILSSLKEELVLIQKENETIETKLNDQDSLHLILRLMKSS